MITITTNTYLAKKEVESKLRMARMQHQNALNMNKREFGEVFVAKKVRDTRAMVEKYEAELAHYEETGVQNSTPVAPVQTVRSEKATRKAAKKADKRNNLNRSQPKQKTPGQKKRQFTGPRLTQAEIREQQILTELQRFEKFKLNSRLQAKLDKMPSNQGMYVGPTLFVGVAPPQGDPAVFTYTKREEEGDEFKIYKYVTTVTSDGYRRETKYYRDEVVSTKYHQSPYTSALAPKPGYTADENDFPELSRAVVVPHRRVEPDVSFTTVTRRKATPAKKPIVLNAGIKATLAKMPGNTGMIICNKVFWGKQPATKHSTRRATKRVTIDGVDGLLQYTWSRRVYREHFRPKGSNRWIPLVNESINGEVRMRPFM